MRIAHAIGSLDPAAGGPPAVLWRLASAQARLGHETTVVGARDPERHGVILDYCKSIRGLDRIRIGAVDTPTGLLARPFGASLAPTLRALGPFDVVHMHGVWDVSFLSIASWCRKVGIPYVVRPAGMLDVWSLRQSRLKKRVALALAYRRMLAGAGAIHALNAHERDTIGALGFGSPIVVIPNGVFLEEIELAAEPALFREAHPDLGDRPYVLFLSRLHYKKGLDILAEAWARVGKAFPEHRLVVAGPRQDDTIDLLRRRLSEEGLSESLVEVGEIYADMKTAAFRGAECFVLPSRQEGFSVAVTEALALGVPVVISRECHFPEVTEAGAGIETSLEPRDVAEGVSRMLSEPTLRVESGRAGARLIRERFTWPRIAEQTLDVYARLGAGRASDPGAPRPGASADEGAPIDR
jgi:glycosyltransferase involved in cell wall biosynthesis